MATLAVFVALGGTSYAAITISGKNVKDGSLTGADIKNNSIGTSDVHDGSLLRKDFKKSQLGSAKVGPRGATGAKGDAGPKGATGAKGNDGAAGAPGLSGYEVVVSGVFISGAGNQDFGTVFCPAGKKAISGGVGSLGAGEIMTSSYPTPDDTGWTVYMRNTSLQNGQFAIRAECAIVS